MTDSKQIVLKKLVSDFDEYRKHPNHEIILRRLVGNLLEVDRLVEAKYFAQKLEVMQIGRESLKTIFMTACKTCDQKLAVRTYNKLIKMGASETNHHYLATVFLLTFKRDDEQLKLVLRMLSSKSRIQPEELKILIEGLRVTRDPDVCANVVLNFNLRFNESSVYEFRKILISKIIDMIRQRGYV